MKEPTKRIYKQPTFLKYSYQNRDWEKYETKWVRDVVKTEHDTEKETYTSYISDIYYREKEQIPWRYAYSNRRRQGNRKFPCIGGPLAGQNAIINTPEYSAFNNASGRSTPKVILIHDSLF